MEDDADMTGYTPKGRIREHARKKKQQLKREGKRKKVLGQRCHFAS
jgi:hypothetical protein